MTLFRRHNDVIIDCVMCPLGAGKYVEYVETAIQSIFACASRSVIVCSGNGFLPILGTNLIMATLSFRNVHLVPHTQCWQVCFHIGRHMFIYAMAGSIQFVTNVIIYPCWV